MRCYPVASMALAFLSGHLQIAFYVAFAVALWWLWRFVQVRKSDGRGYALIVVGSLAAACVVVAGLIAAAQIIPTLDLAANSHGLERRARKDMQVTSPSEWVPIDS